MRPLKLDIDPADVDADGIAESQQPAAGGVQSLALDGALCDLGTAGVFHVNDSDSSGIKGRILAIASDADDSGRTFVITGTDPEGAALVESVAGPNTTTVLSSEFFESVTSITVDADTAGNITVGTSNATNSLCTKTVRLNWRDNYPVTVAIMGSSGTYVADIEETFDELAHQTSQDVNWIDLHADVSADGALSMTRHAQGLRLHLDSYTNSAEFQFHVIQN